MMNDNDTGQLASSTSAGDQSGMFSAQGIFLNGDSFTCLICNKPLLRLLGIPTHMSGTRHRLKFEDIHANSTNIDGCIKCKLCTNYLADNWQTFIRHFYDKQHFDDLKEKRKRSSKGSSDPNISYILLLMNQIIELESGIFFCCCCKKRIVGWVRVSEHISQKNHVKLQEPCDRTDDIGKCNEKDARNFVKNCLFHVSAAQFHCNLCDLLVNGLRNCIQHIGGTRHAVNMTEENVEPQSLDKNEEACENPKNQAPELLTNVSSKSFAGQSRKNSITGPSENGHYYCKLCKCNLTTVTIPSHLASKQHRVLMMHASDESTSVSENEEMSDSSSSSSESIDNSTDGWETFDGQSQSFASSENLLQSWKFSDNATDSWEMISIPSRDTMLFDIPENLTPQISKDLLQIRETEIYCVPCHSHLINLQSLIAHTNSKRHNAILKNHNSKITQKNEDLLGHSGTNSVVKSLASPSQPATGNKSLTQKDVAKELEALQPKLFEIPPNFTPLISKHMLEKRQNEIYCIACKAHLRSLQSLLDHTESKYHIAELNSYRAKVAQEHTKLASASSSVNNTTSNEKLSINSKQVSISSPKDVSKKSGDSPAKLLKIPDHLISVLPLHSLQHLEHEIFCPACRVHLLHPNNMIQHIKSTNHIVKLKAYKAGILGNGENSGKTAKKHAAVNLLTNVDDVKKLNTNCKNKTATLKTVTTNPQKPQSNLMHIPEEFLPIITIHSLKHLEDEIYCEACKVHLKHVSSLISHTRSRKHIANLELFRASTKSQNMVTHNQKSVQHGVIDETVKIKLQPNQKTRTDASENITSLENSIENLRIVEVEAGNSVASNGNKLRQDDIKNPKYNRNSKNLLQNQSKKSKYQPANKRKLERQIPRQKKSRDIDPKYLEDKMQHIYEVNPEKLRIIKLSCQLCFPKSLDTVYCLICEKSVDSKLQTFYEHISSIAHIMYLSEAEQNDQHFINFQNQFSDLTLAKEFMQENSEEIVQCLACDTSMEDNSVVILKHIEQKSHKERKQLWNEVMEKILQDILVQIESTWYNIQKYWCQPCNTDYNTEFHFAEHMDSKWHNDCIKKLHVFNNTLVYDSCIPCAMLWLGFSGIYTQHCEQPMHKYLVKTGDYSICSLSDQANNLLKNAEKEVVNLIASSDEVLTDQKVKADVLLKCLENTVKSEFPDAKAYPFGSRVSGLGFPDSDIDVFLDCSTYNGQNDTRNYEFLILKSVERCLSSNQQLWEIEETLTSSRTPIIKLYHRSTQLRCDVSFKNGLSVENTKLLKCFIDNYPLCRKLMLFLKKWLSLCNLSGSQYITNYAACWYVIFYLQRKSILPSVASLITIENKSKIIDGWEAGICETFEVDGQELTFMELLHGFFVFYSNFDYRNSVACPIIGRTILKQDFTKLDLLPKQMAPYVKHIHTKSAKGPVELFRIDSEMCIQDPYDLSHNLTKAVRKFTVNRFRRLCAASADILNNFI